MTGAERPGGDRPGDLGAMPDEGPDALETPEALGPGGEVRPAESIPSGRELVRREAVPPSVERFTAPDTAHTVGLTEERAAQIVRQSANARSIGLVTVLFLAVFIPVYWFWENGFPLMTGTSRLAAEANTQYVTDVTRGELVYLANCARCHGPQGKSDIGLYGYVDSHGTVVIGYSAGIGPPLNDQDKLYQALTVDRQPGPGHLNPNYLQSVMREGGRIVCGDANSIMPVWALENGGPLDYRAVEELIAFLTASNEITWESVSVDPVTGARTTEARQGWRDPDYDPGPNATPFPACWRATPPPTGPTTAPTLPPDVTPGTPEDPRVIALEATASLTFVPDAVVLIGGETVRFEVENTAGFVHNFYIGTVDDLGARDYSALVGIPDFTSGTETLDYTVPASGEIAFGCLVPGHWEAGMRGTFALVQQ